MRVAGSLLLAVLVAPSLSGCAAFVLAGAGTAAVAAHDRRTLGAMLDDQTIELKASSAVNSDDELHENTHVNVTSMNGIVLLSGEATTPEQRDRVLAKMREIPAIRRIVNELRVAPPSTAANRGNDTWLTTKVKTKLIHTEGVDSTRIKVVTENSVVYLLGLVSQKEADIATDAARTVGGVDRVVKVFEFID